MSMGDLTIFLRCSPNLVLERLEVLVIQIFHLFGQSYPKIFYIICDYCEGSYFSNFIFSQFIICIKEVYDSFELILYPATWLKLFISCRSSLVEFLWLLMYTIISSVNNNTLTSSFPICIPLISFCLTALARTLSTIQNI